MQDKNQNLLYFAYGEHMNEEEMKKLCPQARKVGMSALEGYTLCFFGRDGMGRAGLEAAPGRHVPGCVWVLPEAQAEQLDQEADCPYFARREIRTFSIGGMALPRWSTSPCPASSGEGRGLWRTISCGRPMPRPGWTWPSCRKPPRAARREPMRRLRGQTDSGILRKKG